MSRLRIVQYLVLATLVSYPLGLALGRAWLLPILNAAPAYVAMVLLLRRGDRRAAVGTVLIWALGLAIFGTLSFALWPEAPDKLVLHGPAYVEEMFHWILTGEGTEGSIRHFLPQHALHLATFVILSLATASGASILMGAVLMNYMGFYVASLARVGVPVGTVLLFGWQPWAIARVTAFCILGAVLAEPLLNRIRPYRYPGLGAARPYIRCAAALLLVDVALKWALAPHWGLVLRAAFGVE